MTVSNTTATSMQWMVEVGVEPIDVTWLAGIAGTEHLHDPAVAKRVKEIHDVASAGLLATIKTPFRAEARV